MLRPPSVLNVWLFLLSACASQAGLNSQSGPSSPPGPAVQPTGNSSEAREGDPLVQQFLADLQQRNIELTLPEKSRVAWLSDAPGLGYRVGPEWLHIHLYADTAAAKANADRIPADAGMGLADWVAPPHFYQCDRIIALYLGQDMSVISVLSELCGQPFAEFYGY